MVDAQERGIYTLCIPTLLGSAGSRFLHSPKIFVDEITHKCKSKLFLNTPMALKQMCIFVPVPLMH